MIKSPKKTIDIIIPCYNERENVTFLIDGIQRYIEKPKYDCQFIFVDDGSTDDTYEFLLNLSKSRKGITAVKLSRNFGKEAAITAGLTYCNSDAAIIIDSDLQHPPHLLPSLIAEWERGADIVDAIKVTRQKENIIKKIVALAFNKIMSNLTGMDFAGSSDYKLLDRKAISVLNRIDERNRFFRGLTNWIGFKHCKIEFHVQERMAGKSKWNWLRLVRLSIDAITSYSSKPLQIVTILGTITLLFSLILGVQTLYNKFFGGAVSGFTTVILIILILCSFIMISMGVLGIYITQIYDEVKNRPIYIISKTEDSPREKASSRSTLSANSRH